MSSSTSSSSSSSISSLSNDVIKSEKQNQEEEFGEILRELEQMACGFEVNAPQSLEFLFEDHQIPPPTSKPESLEIQRESGHELYSRVVEPGLDDYNEWLNYLDNQTL